MWRIITIGLVLCSVLSSTEGKVKGAVPLDDYNFDRVISRFDTVVVKFDAVYPFGELHDAFRQVAEGLKDSDDILFVEIGIKDFGEHDNEKLGQRFGVKSKADWPALRLFVKGKDEPYIMNNNDIWTVDEIKKFIRDNSNVYLGLRGCIKTFDDLASEFTNAKDKKAVYEEAQKKVESLTDENEKKTANTYLKFMKKALEKESFLEDEKQRLQKLIQKGKIKPEKKENIEIKANILSSFNPTKVEL